LAITAVPPFSIFQSEFIIHSTAVKARHPWLAFIFIACIVAIFAGFLRHAVQMNLGAPPEDTAPAPRCPWKLDAMLLIAIIILVLGFILPDNHYQLVQRTAAILNGDN